MLLSLLLGLFLVVLLPQSSDATALTYSLPANEDACFYIWADKPGKKLGFYFAVKFIILHVKYIFMLINLQIIYIGSTRWIIRY